MQVITVLEVHRYRAVSELYRSSSTCSTCSTYCSHLCSKAKSMERQGQNDDGEEETTSGPEEFPLFGSLHLLGKLPHHSLHKLAQKYGLIMHMRLGLTPTIFVSSPEAAELFLKTYDLVFASRPPHEAAKHMSWGQRNMIFAPYGSYWRDMRKLCTLELLSSVKISSLKAMRKEEIGLLIEFIKKDASDRVAIDLIAKIISLNADVSCRMVLGKRYSDEEFDERGFKAVIQEALHLAAAPNLGDYILFLAPLRLAEASPAHEGSCKGVFDDFFVKIINNHILSKNEDGKTKTSLMSC